MWMRPIAALSVAPSRRRRIVVGGTDIAAAVLNATSCSVTRTCVVPRWVEPSADGADPTSGVAVDPGGNCDILRMPPRWVVAPDGVTASVLVDGCRPRTGAGVVVMMVSSTRMVMVWAGAHRGSFSRHRARRHRGLHRSLPPAGTYVVDGSPRRRCAYTRTVRSFAGLVSTFAGVPLGWDSFEGRNRVGWGDGQVSTIRHGDLSAHRS